MKKYLKRSIVLVLPVIVLICIICFNKEKKQLDDYINISELSDEFINEYFEELSSVKTNEEKENMLIVISDKEIKNTYGAKKVINAPNNQYILQYESEDEKNNALSILKGDDSIYAVEENGVYTIEEVDYNSWGIEAMSLDYAINFSNSYSSNMQSVIVAIIDTGCDMTLFNKYYGGKITEFYNVLEQSAATMVDENGHGTHVAGTIAEGTPDNVKIIPIKISRDGNMYYSDIIAAINYIVRYEKADVINMSLGGYGYSEALEQAIESANKKNIISVTSAGNDNTNKNHYPSSFDNTISISSVDSSLNKSSFSNYGSSISFAAPGTAIKSIMGKDTVISKKNGNADGDDDHETISGTSMAAPHAASAVAVLKSYNKNLTLENVIDILKDNSIDLGEKGWDQYYGNGLISFKDVEFCDGTYCDELGVYKDLNKNITNIELSELKFTKYNYYSITNLMDSKVNVTYNDSTNEELILGELQNVEISNYDPTASGSQTVTIKVENLTINIQVTNPNNYESGWEYRELDNNQIELTNYKSHDLAIKKLYIPEKIDSKDVVALADNVEFSELSNDFLTYTYLYLPEHFYRIGDYSLSETTIEYIYGNTEGVEIGNHALEFSSIINIDLPIIKVGDYAFRECYELLSLSIKGEYYYSNANKLSVGKYAFYNCKKLMKVQKIIEDEVYVESVGEYAFHNCISLASFNLKLSGDIEQYAFAKCYSLITLDLSDVQAIGKYSFYSSGINEVEFSYKLEIVNESAFENCKNLKKVDFVGGRIESRAFWNDSVEIISLGDLIEYISEDAFAYNPVKNCDSVTNSDKYLVESNLGIIEKDTNKLIVGFTSNKYGNNAASNTNITDNITEIGKYAFTGNNSLKKIIIPETVTKIGEYAFQDCYNLSDVYMLGDSIEFDDDTFKRTFDGDIKDQNLYIYVYKDSQIKNLVKEKNLYYRHIEPDEIIVTNYEDTYNALSQVDFRNLSVKLIYHEEEDREEVLSPLDNGIVAPISRGVGFYVSYQNENAYNFQYGDTYYIVHAKNQLGYETIKNVEVNVSKATPSYSIPTDLTANLGQKLSSVELPTGFEWMDGNEIINKNGEVVFKAKYVPNDTINYEIVENIDITILVLNDKKVVNPNITINDKIYDGTKNISISSINVSDLNTDDYSVVNAISSSIDVGKSTATLKLKLSNEKFEDYMFDNGKQEKEFMVNFQIIKANIKIKDSSKDVTVIYDGNPHSIQMDLVYDAGAIVKYMDDNNEYTLDEIPKYKAVGTYVTKYKVYINDNYNDYYGQKTLTIVEDFDYKINNYPVDNDNNYISNIDVNTEVNAFTPNFILGYGYGIDVDYKTINNKNVLYTGGKTRITHGLDTYREFTNIILGDTNGDGKINYLDYVNVYNHIQKTKHPESSKKLLESAYLIAGDMSEDNKISYLDYVKIYNKIKELKGGN